MATPVTDDVNLAICSLIAEQLRLPAGEVTASSDLRNLPGVESIEILRIIAKIERKYGVEFDDQLVFKVRTVAEIASAISRLQSGTKGP